MQGSSQAPENMSFPGTRIQKPSEIEAFLSMSPQETLRSRHHCSCLHLTPILSRSPSQVSPTSAQPTSPPKPALCDLTLNITLHLLLLALTAVISQLPNSKFLKEELDLSLSSCGSVSHASWWMSALDSQEGWVSCTSGTPLLHCVS